MRIQLVVIFFLFSNHVFSQAFDKYEFSYSQTNALPEISGHSNIAITNHEIIGNNITSYIIKLPFEFDIYYTKMDSVSISKNGFLWFGSASENDMKSITNPISFVRPTSVTGVISALGTKLYPINTPDIRSSIRSGVIGNAPERTLIIEWKNFSRIEYINGGTAPDTLTFQVWLSENGKFIEFYYNHIGLNRSLTSNCEVGFLDAISTRFHNRSTEISKAWSHTREGAKKDATCELSENIFPEHGIMYTWEKIRITSVDELNKDLKLKVYPNPGSDRIEIVTGIADLTSLSIMDINGRVIHQETFKHNTVLNTQHWNRGMYVIQLKGDGNTLQTKKLVLH